MQKLKEDIQQALINSILISKNLKASFQVRELQM